MEAHMRRLAVRVLQMMEGAVMGIVAMEVFIQILNTALLVAMVAVLGILIARLLKKNAK